MPNEQTPNPGAPVASGSAAPAVTGPFSPDQLQQMAQWEVDRGKLTREQADAMLAVDGVQSLPPPLSPEAAAIDKEFPPAKIHEYDLAPLYDAGGQEMTREQREFDTKARGWLVEGRFPKGIGTSLANEIAREAERAAKYTLADRELSHKTAMAQLQRLWGGEADKRIKLARQLVRELDKKSPGLADLLYETNAANNPMVVQLLAAQAERLLMRQGKSR